MACLISKRGKIYRQLRLDIWNYYRTYFNEDTLSEWKKIDHTLHYWAKVRLVKKELKELKKHRYVYRIWNRRRYEKLKYFKPNYIIPRYLRNFYLILKKHNFVNFIKKSLKGKLIRGFVSTYLNFLEGRLIVIVYRLNLINNIFIIKTLIKFGIFQVNFNEKKHINTRVKLGDFLTINKKWLPIIKRDLLYRLNRDLISCNINNFYANYINFYFFFLKILNIKI